MITNFKIYEKLWSKNIKVGDIYEIESMLIAHKGYVSNIPLGRIIRRFENSTLFDVKTFTKNNHEEYIMEYLSVANLKRKATQEEIQEFEAIENSKKYNL
jgi:hypothetical protein